MKECNLTVVMVECIPMVCDMRYFIDYVDGWMVVDCVFCLCLWHIIQNNEREKTRFFSRTFCYNMIRMVTFAERQFAEMFTPFHHYPHFYFSIWEILLVPMCILVFSESWKTSVPTFNFFVFLFIVAVFVSTHFSPLKTKKKSDLPTLLFQEPLWTNKHIFFGLRGV